MDFDHTVDNFLREQLAELLYGGFAPVVPLLREFNYEKSGIVLEGLHFSAWSLLNHMQKRQHDLLQLMKDPEKDAEFWPEPYWPTEHVPKNEAEWKNGIATFEETLNNMISVVRNPETPLYDIQKKSKSIFFSAVTNLQHNAYHIGQIKTIGRQLGVW